MSEVSPTGLTAIDEVKGGGRTLIFSSRLVMASNTTLQLSLLFAFLYLRANNFGGSFHPSGVGTPPQVLALISLAFPVIGVLALWTVWSTVSKSRDIERVDRDALAGGSRRRPHGSRAHPAHVPVQLDARQRLGLTPTSSTLWYAVLLAEFIGVGLWLLSLVMGHVRGTDRLSTAHARAILEQWTYITGVSIAVYLLIQYAS